MEKARIGKSPYEKMKVVKICNALSKTSEGHNQIVKSNYCHAGITIRCNCSGTQMHAFLEQ